MDYLRRKAKEKPSGTIRTEEHVELQHVEYLLQILGDPGPFQIIQFILLGLPFISMSFDDFMVIFYSLAPTSVRCYGGPHDVMDYNSSTSTNLSDRTPPVYVGNSSATACHCPQGFEYTYTGRQWSIIGDMDLICDRSSLVNLASVIYFLGEACATPFSGWTADRFGRRPVLLVSNTIHAILLTALVFSRDYTSFVLLRFFIGATKQAMNSSTYVLMMEWITARRRGTWGAFSEFYFTLGLLSLALVAYLLQNWIHIQAFFAAASFAFIIPLYWFAPESLTWLYSKHRPEQMIETCRFIAKFNKLDLSEEVVLKIKTFSQNYPEEMNASRNYSFADCFRTPYIRKTTFLCLITWFACFFGYLGVTYMNSDMQMASDVYLNLAINGFLEPIPILLAILVASKLGHRLPLTFYFLTGGVFAIIAGFVGGFGSEHLVAQTALAFISRMAFFGTLCVIFVYTTELFPTDIRSNAFCLCSTNLRIASLFTPLLPLMSAKSSFKGGGFILVGVVSMIAAVSTWLLRETKGQPLPRTVAEVEKMALDIQAKKPQQVPPLGRWLRKSTANGGGTGGVELSTQTSQSHRE
ncbi:hypothetical protein RvY_06091 [Ramazzottius varieornatus]|uniref:Major facilitator superfamily (MFS) profile domain-containing protein n=1 Tax=Ramazzottius varieornatus TaxID=947166 RepID=A0A1D1UXT8_RAMVA|nr:hypothetical protein RvY_06091 [Ramazzottius varieornatus]